VIDWRNLTWHIDLQDDVKTWLSEYARGRYRYTRMMNGQFGDIMHSDYLTIVFDDVNTAMLFKLTYYTAATNTQNVPEQWVQSLHRAIQLRVQQC
jgi:hypothetical protein